MCGIIGYISLHGPGPDEHLLDRMNQCQRLRGPDSEGKVVLDGGRVGLAQTRLSIIDLSDRARQPMATEDGRHWITYNGEVYNFQELRAELEGLGEHFRTHSDTEVLLLALRRWGEDAVARFEGIFALVYADLDKGYVLAARDRLGIKPMSVFDNGELVGFASTVTPLRLLPGFTGEIDPIARFEMISAKYTVAPRTIFAQIRKLMPGTWMRIGFDGSRHTEEYWSLPDYFEATDLPVRGPEAEEAWLEAIHAAVRKAVKRQLVADVPLGVFLSGGIDSSLVAAVAREQAGRKVKTFSIGFSAKEYDESHYARAIAEHLDTDHHEFMVTPEHVISTFEAITDVYDEPFGDASAVPTHILSKFTREHVTVALSGDGGDEQFFGYGRYHMLAKLSPWLQRMPGWLTRAITAWNRIAPGFLPKPTINALFAFPDKADIYPNFVWSSFATLAEQAGAGEAGTMWRSGLWERNRLGYEMAAGRPDRFLEAMMLSDCLSYMPDDCLVKVDRASMACSLEARVPLLDEEVLRVSRSMPVGMSWRDGEGKYLLKKLLCRYVPDELVYRPKMGFGVPLDQWLFHEMEDFTMAVLSRENILKAELDPDGVAAIMDVHKSGRGDMQYFLWPLICYVAWYNRLAA